MRLRPLRGETIRGAQASESRPPVCRRGNEDPRILDCVNACRAADTQIPRDYRVGYMAFDKAINLQCH